MNFEIGKNKLFPYPHSHHVFLRWRFDTKAVLVFRWLSRFLKVLFQRRDFKVSKDGSQHNDDLVGGESTTWTLTVSNLS
jgi:hypothetical protein